GRLPIRLSAGRSGARTPVAVTIPGERGQRAGGIDGLGRPAMLLARLLLERYPHARTVSRGAYEAWCPARRGIILELHPVFIPARIDRVAGGCDRCELPPGRQWSRCLP